jgi:surface protein
MPLAGKNKADRARAHLQWADRYSKYGDTHKAAAHFGRALEYDRLHAFGVVEEGERAPAAVNRAPEKQQVSRIDQLPFNLKWKIFTQNGCDRAIEETRDASIETRQGLYDTQMTKDIDRASLFVPEQCRLASGLDEQHPNFTYRCSRFFQNCAERDGRSDARVMNLTDVTIREVLAQHRTAITNGTFYPPIGEWNVSRVTNMRDLFNGWAEFNSPLEKWDTSNVLNMAGMFSGCRDFNQPIGRWDTSRVTRMSRMFNGAVAFNQPIGDWKTGRVEIMNTMFEDAEAFQQDISGWDVTSVRSAWAMFEHTTLPMHMRPRLTPEQIND